MQIEHLFVEYAGSRSAGGSLSGYENLKFLFLRSQLPKFHNVTNFDEAKKTGVALKADILCLHFESSFFVDLGALNRSLTGEIQQSYRSGELLAHFRTPSGSCIAVSKELLGIAQSWNHLSQFPSRAFSDESLQHLHSLSESQRLELNQLLERYMQNGILAPDLAEDSFSKRILETIQTDERFSKELIFLCNNESLLLPPEVAREPIAELFVLASGLKPIVLFHQLNTQKLERVVFYDLSKPALQFYAHLIDTWDGDDYGDWMRKTLVNDSLPFHRALLHSPDLHGQILDEDGLYETALARLTAKFDLAVDACGGKAQFKKTLMNLRATNKEYLHVDLISDFAKLRLNSNLRPVFIWLSNVYSYRPTFFKHGGKKSLEEKFLGFFNHCAHLSRSVYLAGENPILGQTLTQRVPSTV